MAQFARQFQESRWLQVLLAALFLSRALVPMGYMPGEGGMMLCPAYAHGQAAAADAMPMDIAGMHMAGMHMAGMHMAGMDMAGMHHMPGMAHEGSCSFAAAACALASVHSFPPVAYSPSVPEEILAPPERQLPRGTIVPTRLPRGPPALS